MQATSERGVFAGVGNERGVAERFGHTSPPGCSPLTRRVCLSNGRKGPLGKIALALKRCVRSASAIRHAARSVAISLKIPSD
jgi:hypothetical protein